MADPQNKVVDTMAPPCDSTVYLFGWNLKESRLSLDLGQPKGESIGEMWLNPMRHAIISNKGEDNFLIKVHLPRSTLEYVTILAVPGAVFVARYSTLGFSAAGIDELHRDLKTLAGRMNAKMQELARRDEPFEQGVPEGSYFAIYYPQVLTVEHDRTDYVMVHRLKDKWKFSPMEFQSVMFGPGEATVVVTVPRVWLGLASHCFE